MHVDASHNCDVLLNVMKPEMSVMYFRTDVVRIFYALNSALLKYYLSFLLLCELVFTAFLCTLSSG